MQIIAARSLNNVIGQDDSIPWRAKGEQKLFKDITMGGVLLMGRKTFESIGRPLPGRTTVIVTRDNNYQHENCEVRQNLESAIREFPDAFVAGGGEIYKQALPTASAVHLTTVQCEVEGNILFPEFPEESFRLIKERYYKSNIDYLYQLYERN